MCLILGNVEVIQKILYTLMYKIYRNDYNRTTKTYNKISFSKTWNYTGPF